VTYALRRVFVTVPLLLVVSVVVFALVDLLPGDAADRKFERYPALKAEWRAKRGLDDPFLVRWGRYVTGVFRGDFDRSYQTDQPVGAELIEKLQATLELTLVAMVIAIVVGGTVGIASAAYPRTVIDYAGGLLAMCGISMPVFWLGMLLLMVVVNVLGLGFESGRLGDIDVKGLSTSMYLLESPFRLRFDVFRSALEHVWLPALALSTIPMAVLTRMTRAAMRDEMGRDYATTARAKGLTQRRVVLKHVLRNAAIPVTTITGIQFGQLMGGAVLTVTVFSGPGLGLYIVNKGVLARDTPIIVGGILLVSTTFVLVNLAVDLAYAVIDPRVRRAS
jgi:peptide/nickel transport system permease protein